MVNISLNRGLRWDYAALVPMEYKMLGRAEYEKRRLLVGSFSIQALLSNCTPWPMTGTYTLVQQGGPYVRSSMKT